MGLFLCMPSYGQDAEIGITGGYSTFRDGQIASTGGGAVSTTYEYTDGIRIGARMSFDFRKYFAHELSYAFQSSKFKATVDDRESKILTVTESRSQIHNYYYNFVVHATPRDARVRPFVTGGVGGTAFIPPGYSSFQVQGQTKLGYNYGAGIKFLATDNYGIRFDVRDHATGKPFFRNTDGMLHSLETSMTFSFLF